MDHVDDLEMLADLLVQAGIEVLVPRSQVAGPEIPAHRLIEAKVNPKIQEENVNLLENAFCRFSWYSLVLKSDFLAGTTFLMTDPIVRGTQTWRVCDKPMIFMSPAALGLDHEKETWWAVSSGLWCPVLCCLCECCSQWWWWWEWQCGGGGGGGSGQRKCR